MGDTKRKMLTPEERIAKAKAELEALEAKAADRDRKRYSELGEQRAKHVAVIDERTAKVEAIDTEMHEIDARLPMTTEGEPVLSVVANEADDSVEQTTREVGQVV